MNIECNSNFNQIGFKGCVKVLRTPESDAVIEAVAVKFGDNLETNMRVVLGEKVTDILFHNELAELETLQTLNSANAQMVYKKGDVSEKGFRLRVLAGNTFEQKTKCK